MMVTGRRDMNGVSTKYANQHITERDHLMAMWNGGLLVRLNQVPGNMEPWGNIPVASRNEGTDWEKE
jgi:hypothetical protein